MDPQVRRRATTPFTIYPFDKKVDGDSTFKTPVEGKGSFVFREGKREDREGEMVVFKTVIYVDGQSEPIKKFDEIVADGFNRVPVKYVHHYNDLTDKVLLYEVYL